MCADNGVVEEGVTQTGQEVTAIVSENYVHGGTSVCRMSHVAGADVIPVGHWCRPPGKGWEDPPEKISGGNSQHDPRSAMTREEAERPS